MARRVKIVAIIQARMSSARLPGKVLRKIGDKSMLEMIIGRIRQSRLIDSILIATTGKDEDAGIIKLAKRLNIAFFMGSEDNVLKRFIDASRSIGSSIVIRVTADNPLVDPVLTDGLIRSHLRARADYTYCVGAPLGISVEVITRDVLEKIYPVANTSAYKEDVTSYILENPQQFKIKTLKASDFNLGYPHLRLTVDTANDLKLFRALNRNLGDLTRLRTQRVVAFLRQNPWLLKINADVEEKVPRTNKSVSVIIRTHNSARFVRRAIDSVLNQDVPAQCYEILVIDDGSTDDTRQIVKSYDKRVRLIREHNLGYVKAINRGITHARGRYVMLLDADDVFRPNIISEMLGVFKGNKDLGFVYCDYYETDTRSNKTKIVSLKNIFNSLAGGIIFRRDVLREVGEYDEGLVFPEYDLLIRIMARFKGAYIPKPFFTYYRHKDSLTADKERVELGRNQLFARYGFIKGLRDY